MSPDLMTWLAVLAFVLGIIALLLEIFVAPGFGVSGVVGIILLIWGVVFLTVDFTQTISSLVIALIATVVLFIVGLKVSSRLKLWQRMTLQDKQENSSGYVGPVHEEDLVPGLEGKTVTPLRPAGTAVFHGKRIDVVTSGEFIPSGQAVRLIKLEGTRVVVEQIQS